MYFSSSCFLFLLLCSNTILYHKNKPYSSLSFCKLIYTLFMMLKQRSPGIISRNIFVYFNPVFIAIIFVGGFIHSVLRRQNALLIDDSYIIIWLARFSLISHITVAIGVSYLIYFLIKNYEEKEKQQRKIFLGVYREQENFSKRYISVVKKSRGTQTSRSRFEGSSPLPSWSSSPPSSQHLRHHHTNPPVVHNSRTAQEMRYYGYRSFPSAPSLGDTADDAMEIQSDHHYHWCVYLCDDKRFFSNNKQSQEWK